MPIDLDLFTTQVPELQLLDLRHRGHGLLGDPSLGPHGGLCQWPSHRCDARPTGGLQRRPGNGHGELRGRGYQDVGGGRVPGLKPAL